MHNREPELPPPTVRDPRESFYRIACLAMYVFGVVLALPGTVLGLPDAATRFGLTLANRGALIAALFAGLLGGSILSSATVDRLGHRASLVVSCLGVAVCLPLFAVAGGYEWALAALVATGAAGAGINTASNALASDSFPDERGRRMNGIAVAVGLGGLSLPAAIALLAGRLSWPVVVAAAGGLAAAVAVAAARARVPPRAASAAASFAAVRLLAGQRRVAWFAVLVMLAAGTEASMAGFTSTYLAVRGFGPAAATWALTSHWVGLIAGRLAFARRVDSGKGRAIKAAAVGGAVAIAGFAWLTLPAWLAVAPLLVGVAIGTVMPTALALGGERIDGQAGALFGLLLTLAQVGSIVLPALVGLLAESRGVAWAMTAVAVNSLLAALACRRAERAAPAR